MSCPSSTIITISNEGGEGSGGGGGGDGGDGGEWGDSAPYSKHLRQREREKRGDRGGKKEEVTIGKKGKDRREKMCSKSQVMDENSSRDKCRYELDFFCCS